MIDGSLVTSHDYLASYDQTSNGWSWKTRQDFLPWEANTLTLLSQHLGQSSAIWPRSAWMRNLRLFPQRTSERRIYANDGFAWPTPTSQDGKNNAGASQWNRRSDPLNVAVLRRWPTPRSVTAMSASLTNAHLAKFPNLETVVARTEIDNSSSEVSQINGYLNPTWVESYLMGYPLGYTDLTDCEPLATPSCRRSPSGSAGESSRSKETDE